MVEFPKTMTEFLPPGRVGVAEIVHRTVTEDEAKFGNLRAMLHGDRDSLVTPGVYVVLKVNGELVMSDTQMERRTNREFVEQAHGRVLIAGLGIGLVLHALRRNRNVKEITVIEKCADVVALVGPTIPAGIQVVTADIFKWKPKRGQRFDTMYFDIWPDVCEDNLKEARVLKARFRHYFASGGKMSAWKVCE